MLRSFLAKLALFTLLLSTLGAAIAPALAAVPTAPATAPVADTVPPSFVENVKATPGDGAVTVSWDAATDNKAVTGYAIYYGTTSVVQAYLDLEEGEDPSLIQYDEVVDVDNVLEYKVEGLTNDVAYYFAVIAVDAAGNESLEYSEEVSATPVAADVADDGKPPSVVSAVASRCTTVELTFSENVTAPAVNPENSFTIEDFDTLEFLKVKNAVKSPLANTLTLTTDPMKKGAQYRLTVGVGVKDKFNNPMVSGTSDTAVFTGVECLAKEPEVPASTDKEAPKLDKVEVMSPTELWLSFNEPVFFPPFEPVVTPAGEDPVDPRLALFSIFDADKNVIEVMAVEPVLDEPAMIMLITSDHVANTEYFISVTGLLDEIGNATKGDFKSSATYTTMLPEAAPEVDLTPPDNVKNLLSSVMNSLVKLSWQSVGDAVDQYLYVSMDGGKTYERKATLGKNTTNYSFEGGVEGQTYLFKVVTVDENGNQSEGVVTTATLPVTGPGIALLAAASLMGGAGLARKKKHPAVK